MAEHGYAGEREHYLAAGFIAYPTDAQGVVELPKKRCIIISIVSWSAAPTHLDDGNTRIFSINKHWDGETFYRLDAPMFQPRISTQAPEILVRNIGGYIDVVIATEGHSHE